MILTGDYKILKLLYKYFKNERGGFTLLGAGLFLGFILLVNALSGVVYESKEHIKVRINPGEAADIKVEADKIINEIEEQKKKEMDLYKKAIKIPIGIHSDTPVGTLLEESGLLDVKKKNIEKDKKIKTNLEKSGLTSDPLNVGISKIIKAKIENNSTIGTSPEDTDALMIKIMEDIEEEEKLFDSMEDDSDDAIIDMVSHIEKILENNNKLADQKLIALKAKLNRVESHKKYLEGIIKAFEEAEKKGAFQTEGISSVKADLEETNQTINNLETELQQHEDGQGEVSEDTLTDEETQDTLTNEEVTEEITEEAIEEVITLNGTMRDGVNTFTMFMTIDLKTGAVSGIVYIRIYVTDLEYQLDFDAPISGSINLETREINAQVGEEEGMKLTGRLSVDANSANGTGSGDDASFVWSVSR